MPLLLSVLVALLLLVAPASAGARPNVVVLMTDDQTVADLSAMPRTHALLGAGGVTFDRSYVSYPVCCPSRATLFSGQYAHNHGVMGLHPPTGGYARFDAQESLPVWLQRSGYRTAHVGKYLNGYGTDTPADVPPGWSDWYGAVGDSTYRMWGFTLNENGLSKTYGGLFDEDPAELSDRRSGREGGGADRGRRRRRQAAVPVGGLPRPASRGRQRARGHRAHRAARAAPSGRAGRQALPAHARVQRARHVRQAVLPAPPAAARRAARGPGSSTTSAPARSRCSRWTRRWWTSWTRCGARASSTTPTSSSPPTTASCRASTACRAARCSPTTPRPRCRC